MSGTANGLNQLTAVGGVSNSHDSRGNVSAIGSNSYGYSSENLLTSGPSSATLSYDPENRLYQTAGGGTTTRFGYDGSQAIGEYDGSNALQRRYVFGPGGDEPLVWYEGSGTSTRRYFHGDERGSEIAVSDGSGDLYGSNPNRYDEYGNPQGSLTGRFGYTGQAWLPEIGMAYYRARIYNPAMGRFMQTDPSGVDGGMNIYAYVGNNPVNFTDPSGLGDDGDVVVDGPSLHSDTDLFLDSYMFRLSLDFGSDQRIVVVGKRPKARRRCLPKVGSFVQAHRADAERLADNARHGITAQIVLAFSGNESSYGTTNLAHNGNFFGLHNLRRGSYVGQTGTYVTQPPTGTGVPTPIFANDGYYFSGLAALRRLYPNFGNQVLSNPDAFFRIARNNGFAHGATMEDYLSRMRSVTSLVAACL